MPQRGRIEWKEKACDRGLMTEDRSQRTEAE
jgi:hypothetical protein